MSNYYYIIASLPALSQDYAFTRKSPEDILAEIRSLLSKEDNAVIDFVLSAPSDREGYEKVLSSKSAFIREYFAFDLAVKNYKVEWLNKTLSRPAGKDVVVVDKKYQKEAAPEVAKAFATASLLDREKAIDNLYWNKINELTIFNYFDLNVILAFVLKMQIIRRWLLLDEEEGRRKFRELVTEVKGTFKGVPKIEK